MFLLTIFVTEAEYSENLKTLEEVYEGFRLNYSGSQFSLSDATYGKLTYAYKSETEIYVPRYEATVENYPYTGTGFTASKNIILPEWKQEAQKFSKNNLLQIFDAETGELLKTYKFIEGTWILQ